MNDNFGASCICIHLNVCRVRGTPTVVSGVRDHNICIGGDAVRSLLAICLMNNFHPFVQLRPAARLRKRKMHVLATILDFAARVKDVWEPWEISFARKCEHSANCWKMF